MTLLVIGRKKESMGREFSGLEFHKNEWSWRDLV